MRRSRPLLLALTLALAGLAALVAVRRPWESPLERLARQAPTTGV